MVIVAMLPATIFASTPLPQSRPSLSTQAKASVITQWPGAEVYLSWGHSAFRVRDPATGLDLIYNYGTFAVDDPLFIPRFVRGELDYLLTEYPYQPYYNWDTQIEHRAWVEQELNLTPSQTNALYQFLAWNAQPKNAVYRYDFILDNCSTRIRDGLERILGDQLHYQDLPPNHFHESFRTGIDAAVEQRPLYNFLFHIVIGRAADKATDLRQATWRPAELLAIIDQAQVLRDGKLEPLVTQTRQLFSPEPPSNFDTPLQNPAFILWPLAALAAFFSIRNTFRLRKSGEIRVSHWFFRLGDALLFGIVGIIACLVFYLVIWSDHTAVKDNLNVVWLWPLHLPAAFFTFRRKTRRWQAYYFGLAALATAVPLLLWPIWPQPLHVLMLPLMLLIIIRAAWLALRARRLTPKH